MKVLLLNGSRLPGGCLNSQASTLIRNFRLEFPDNALTENESDCLIDSSLSELFSSGEHYDLVILPYSLSPSPADRYSGVRCAAHIRLTPEWRHQQVQILFFGNEDAFEVGRRSMLGTILLTPGIFTTAETSPEGLITEAADIVREDSARQDGTRQEMFGMFLDKFNVEPPADYDRPHSLSGEWTMMRWKEMFDWNGREPQTDDRTFRCMLYFKFMQASSGKRSRFQRKDLKEPEIFGIRGQRFVLIDDLAPKGWENVLSEIIERRSGAVLNCFSRFSTEDGSKEALISEIETWLDQPEASDADAYIIDLHLCEEDFHCPLEESSGMLLARRIKKANKANSIVIFSSSDQADSLAGAERLGAFIVKEDLEDNFSRAESYKVFGEFGRALSKAARLSWLKRYVVLLGEFRSMLDGDEYELLDDFVDLMLADMPEYTLKTAILNLTVFLENYLGAHFLLREDGWLCRREGGEKIVRFRDRVYFRSEKDADGFYNVTDVLFTEEREHRPAGWQEARDSDIRDIVVPLYFFYGIQREVCRKVVTLKRIRNSQIAHGGGAPELRDSDLHYIMDNVVAVVLEHDMKKVGL